LTGLVVGFERSFEDHQVVEAELRLVEETVRSLTGPQVQLDRMVDRWIEPDAVGQPRWDTTLTLDWLRRNHRPPLPGEVPPYPGALVRFLPLAVIASGSPTNLVSGTYHLAALVDPDPVTLWSAVAVNVAAARFLHGRKDFIADLIEALRANQAPDPVLAAVRRVPLESPAALGQLDPARPLDCAHLALWFSYREPRIDVALESVARVDRRGWLGPLTTALLGAREGEKALRPLTPSVANAETLERCLDPMLLGRKAS
jgi:hypothetical protein